jgi:AmpE protein
VDLALIAVVLALVLGHVAPGLGSVRRYGWFIGWLRWLGRVFAGQGVWQGRVGLLLAVGVPVLAVAALQWGLGDRWYGLPIFLFALVALVYTWGPRDLELDVEAVVDARDPA